MSLLLRRRRLFWYCLLLAEEGRAEDIIELNILISDSILKTIKYLFYTVLYISQSQAEQQV